MYTAWTKHLKDQDAKENFQNQVLGSKQVLERLSEIIGEDLKNTEERQMSHKTFESPNWAEHQAYMNGYKQALKTLLKLIDLDQQNELTNRP